MWKKLIICITFISQTPVLSSFSCWIDNYFKYFFYQDNSFTFDIFMYFHIYSWTKIMGGGFKLYNLFSVNKGFISHLFDENLIFFVHLNIVTLQNENFLLLFWFFVCGQQKFSYNPSLWKLKGNQNKLSYSLSLKFQNLAQFSYNVFTTFLSTFQKSTYNPSLTIIICNYF